MTFTLDFTYSNTCTIKSFSHWIYPNKLRLLYADRLRNIQLCCRFPHFPLVRTSSLTLKFASTELYSFKINSESHVFKCLTGKILYGFLWLWVKGFWFIYPFGWYLMSRLYRTPVFRIFISDKKYFKIDSWSSINILIS